MRWFWCLGPTVKGTWREGQKFVGTLRILITPQALYRAGGSRLSPLRSLAIIVVFVVHRQNEGYILFLNREAIFRRSDTEAQVKLGSDCVVHCTLYLLLSLV